MKQIFSKEAKIGLVTIVSLVLLYFGINYLKGVNLFKPVNHYEVEFDNVNGVTISSPVYVEGFKVGLVREIRYDYEKMDKIIVDVSLDEKMRINKGSYITIVNSFLGGAELHIHLNKYVDDYLKPGDRVEGRMGEEMMQSVQEKILPSVEAMLPKIDSILVGLQALVNHPALRQSLEHVERTTSNLEISTRRLNALMERDVPGIVADLKKITNDFSEVSGELKDLNLQQTFDHVNATLANLKVTTEKFNSTDNSLGLLLNDRALYDNLNSTAGNASKLLLDLREHPKRYVHFSVFGKKESSK
ncbi:MAG TPA: MCE family protein [Parabacteroides sp.]|nr:MCE family protein [Parabacteroides sp.]